MKKILSLVFLASSLSGLSQSKIDASIGELVDNKISGIVDKVNKIPLFDGLDTILVVQANKTGSFNIDTLRLSSDGIISFQIFILADGALKSSAGKLVELKRISGVSSVRQGNLGFNLSYTGLSWSVVRINNDISVVQITNNTGRAIKFTYQKTTIK